MGTDGGTCELLDGDPEELLEDEDEDIWNHFLKNPEKNRGCQLQIASKIFKSQQVTVQPKTNNVFSYHVNTST